MTERILNDRYALEAKVGEGGMAVTYRARDLLLNRTVAVKLMREQFTTDPQFVERFRREAQAAARLSHENIAGVYDTGRANGTYYIVMEFVEGTDLKQRLRREGALPVLTVLEIGRQIAAALDAAHRGGLVHRDIKPHNILLNKDSKVKVTDFGIAKAANDGDDTGVIIGSVHYLSPEQARGEATTPASDLYSLGAVLFEMLTGRTVFEGENAMAVAHKQVYERPPMPRTLRPGIPPAVESVVLRCLEKDPRARYQSAAELKAMLTQLLNQLSQEETVVIPAPAASMDATMVYRTPVAAPPQPAPPRPQPAAPPPAPEPEEGNKAGAWLIAILAIVLAGMISYGGFRYIGQLQGGGGGTAVDNQSQQGQLVTVPDLLEQPLTGDQASDMLTRLGFHWQAGREQSATVPEGIVSRQDPAPGTRINPKERKVLYWVSSGTNALILPDVSQMSPEAAQREIGNAGFKGSYATKEEPSEDVTAGNVTRTDPPAGLEVGRKATVTLYVSTGAPQPPPTDTYTPGLTADDLRQDVGADTIYVRIEFESPPGSAPETMWEGTLGEGDAIPDQTFQRQAADQQYLIRLLAGKDAFGKLTKYEEVKIPATVPAQ